MADASTKGSFWPSRTQELLLRTGLSPPEQGLAAWHELGPDFELTQLKPGSLGVLPLVYRRLSQDAPQDAMLPRLKGIYRSTWVKNNLLFERLAEVLDAFEAAGVPTRMMGSLSAAVRYYPEFALRPTAALELLTGVDSLEPACRALGRLGFAARGLLRLDGKEPIALSNRDGQICVLRTEPAVGLDLNVRAAPAQLGRCSLQVIAPEDDLLIACASGARVKPLRSLQWLVDVAQIVACQSSELDWQRLVATAAAHAQALRLRTALSYISHVLDVPVPDHATAILEALPIGRREHLAYRFAGTATGPLGSLPQALGEHLAQTRNTSALATAAAFPAFLRTRWDLDHAWQLPLAGARRAYSVLAADRREAP